MLRSIKVRNFYSIGQEQELSLVISQKDILDESARQIDDNTFLNLIGCVIGHNASGKTTIIKAITFICWLVDQAYTGLKVDRKIPFECHKLFENESSSIQIEFIEHNTLYNYFIEFNRTEIIREILFKKVKRNTKVFELVRNQKDISLDTNLKINEVDLVRFKERKNVPLLSSLIDTGYLREIKFFSNFSSNVNMHGRMARANMSDILETSELLRADDNLRNEVLNFTKDIDLGISDFGFTRLLVPKNEDSKESEKKSLLQCIHSAEEGKFSLPLYEESNGTQHAISLLAEAGHVLKSGGLVIVDEIEIGMHPFLAKKIIGLFEKKETNPLNAQLIFSTHQHILLNDRTKTQIFLTEKTPKKFETEIFSLDEVEGIRNDENFFHKYIAGTYGGTPRTNWL